jgi:hypothetical protein
MQSFSQVNNPYLMQILTSKSSSCNISYKDFMVKKKAPWLRIHFFEQKLAL